MLKSVCPKLPMRNKAITRDFYCRVLSFEDIGNMDFPDYLLIKREAVELHFFLFSSLTPANNYGQVYIRVEGIQRLYQDLVDNGVEIHPNGTLTMKPWQQLEFAVLDPDNNLITFGEPAVGI